MKIAIVLACLFAAASAGNIFAASPLGYAAAPYAAAHSTGESLVQRQEDGIGNYAFSVAEQGATGGTTQNEAGDVYGRKQGSYSLGVVDGRQRRVDWVADEFGFRASVKTNEQGTAPSNPADVLIDSANIGNAHVAPVHAPVASIAAPIVQQPIVQSYAAPIVQRPIVHAAPVVKTIAQPIVQSYAAPIVQRPIVHAPVVKTIAQPIVQQAIVPRPLAYSSVVGHHAPALAVAKPYGLGLNTLGYNTLGLNTLGYGVGLSGLTGLNTYGLGLNGYGLGLNGLGLAPYYK